MTREELIEAILEVFDSVYKPDMRSKTTKKVQAMLHQTKKSGVSVQSPAKYEKMLRNIYAKKG